MFRILTVCTGNICRSPLAEYYLRQHLPADVFSISSAGIMAVPNGEVPKPQLKMAESVGVQGLETHRALMLEASRLGLADLILGMSRAHRKRVVRMDPTLVRKTFTLREFATLAEQVTPEDVEGCLQTEPLPLKAAVEAVARLRGMVSPPLGPDEQDVVDPFRRSRAVYKESRDQLVPAAGVVVAYFNGILELFGAGPTQTLLQEPTEPDVVSQGLPQVPDFPSRSELRRKRK